MDVENFKSFAAIGAVLALPYFWSRLAQHDLPNRKGARVGFLSYLGIHPVKSFSAQPVPNAIVSGSGLEGDRVFCVVDAHSGNFVTQRQRPRLALIAARVENGSLHLAAAGRAPLCVPVPRAPRGGEEIPVTIWGDVAQAVDLGGAAADWVSGFVGGGCKLRLVRHSRGRPPPPSKYLLSSDIVPDLAFPDGFPLLLATRESLAEVERELKLGGNAHNWSDGLVMARFRPNLVVNLIDPSETKSHVPLGAWAEDRWCIVRIGDGGENGRGALLRLAKGCGRCVMTTVDPATGERSGDGEPLATLRRTRMRAGGSAPIFGANAVVLRTGEIRLGDEVRVVSLQPHGARIPV